MLFSELYKIIVNKITFVSFRGATAPIAPPWIRPDSSTSTRSYNSPVQIDCMNIASLTEP